MKKVLGELPNVKSLKVIKFMIYDEPTLAIFRKALNSVRNPKSSLKKQCNNLIIKEGICFVFNARKQRRIKGVR